MTRAPDAEQSIVPRQSEGHWTREPPSVAGWYWIRRMNEHDETNVDYVFENQPLLRSQERWSIPLEPPHE